MGSGTGMICHEFKGGIGSSSRVLEQASGGYTVGVLVQANHGRRERLTINGAPVGAALTVEEFPAPDPAAPGAGSIIVLVATDAPLLPGQCERVARRAAFGIARTGGVGEHWSGDLILAFSTANRGLPGRHDGRRDAAHPVPGDARGRSHQRPLRRGRRGHRGGDPERAARRRDDDRTGRPHGTGHRLASDCSPCWTTTAPGRGEAGDGRGPTRSPRRFASSRSSSSGPTSTWPSRSAARSSSG